MTAFAAAEARADDEPTAAERAAGEALFEEGRRLVEQGRLDEACPRLERAVNVVRRTAGGGLLELAACYEAAGKTASAWTTYSEAEARSIAQGRTDRAEAARARKAAIEPTLHFMETVPAPELARLDGLRLTLDGRPVALDVIAARLPVDPGKRTIRVEALGHHASEVTTDIPTTPGTTRVALRPLSRIVTVDAPVAPTPEENGIGGAGIAGIVALATGGVAMAVGGGLFLAANGAYPAECTDDAGDWIDSSRCSDLADDANDARTLGDVGGGVFWGGLGVAAVGAVLLAIGVASDAPRAANARPAVGLCAGPGFGLCLEGRFM